MPGPRGANPTPGGPFVRESAVEPAHATGNGALPVRAAVRLSAPPIGRLALGFTLPDSLRSLRHRNYRLLFIGNLVSNTGDWMDQIAFNWLVYLLTDSAIYLGLVNLARWLPILIFTLVGGVVADRWERRRLMFTTQAIAMVLALTLAVLDVTGLIQIWMVLAIAAGRGIMMSFNQPAKQGLVSDLVPPQDLRNAIGLNSTQFNLTRIIGPAIGGLLIATVGIAGAFFLNAVSFIAVLWSLAAMDIPPRRAVGNRSVLDDIKGGVNYVRTQPVLQGLLVLALLPVGLGLPYMTMLTVFARDVLRVGGSGLGLLTACSSLGAVGGALYVAAATNVRRGWLMLAAIVMFGLALFGFALSSWVWFSALMLLIVGISQQVYMTTNNTVVQEIVDEEYRGRVLSIVFLNRSMIPLGTMLAGFGTAAFGVQPTMAAMAAALVLTGLLAARLSPAAREVD
ncbi:MAG TPA: MFS transporter [Chloroflexota bacterium]|nr:MFS transporter [Chloroflexota bacterium]